MAGSLPPGVPDDIYATIILKVQQGGAFAVLDSSRISLQYGIKAKPCLIKPNAREVSQLISQDVTSLAEMLGTLPALHDLGAGMVVISAGKDGALFSNGQKHWFCRAPEIKERNPIGAGDAMVAGLVWRLSLEDEPTSALRWAIACGTAAASQPGTGMPERSLVEAFRNQTEVEEV
jgi:1-phosphofructokinase family hexose kinase